MDTRGTLHITAGGRAYKLWMGMSVLADMQALHGADALEKVEPPAGAGPNWMPPLAIILDLVRGSLKRFHAEEIASDPYLADDILAENPEMFAELMAAAFPDQPKAQPSGNGKRPKRAA